MKNKSVNYALIAAIGNIINGILGLSRTKKGFSVFMIIIGFLCLTVDLIEYLTEKNETRVKDISS